MLSCIHRLDSEGFPGGGCLKEHSDKVKWLVCIVTICTSRVVRFVVRFAFRVFGSGRSNPITSRCFVLRDVCFVVYCLAKCALTTHTCV